MKHLEVLRAELERLFDLDGLLTLSAEALGFDPNKIGGQATLSSFAGALLAYCEKEEAVLALADALRASGKDVSPAIAHVTAVPSAEDSLLTPGAELGEFRIGRQLGSGRLSAIYQGRSDTSEARIKVLHPETTRDRQALQRYLVATRLAGTVNNPGLPTLLFAGEVGGRIATMHVHIDGQPLAARVTRTGPMHINEARPLLVSLVEAALALHARGIAHGALSLENIISHRSAEGQAVCLLDIASDRLRSRQGQSRTGLSSTGGNPRTVSPEQIQGADAGPQSDLYSIGAVMYELLSGKPVFDGDVLDVAYSHLKARPQAPSAVAPRGWITSDIDDLVLKLLSKKPSDRGTAQALLGQLDDLGRAKRIENVSDAEIEGLEQQLLSTPENTELAMSLESCVGRGATADRIGQAFRLAASMIDDPIQYEAKSGLLLRAARLLEAGEENLEKAEAVYEELLDMNPRDAVALAGIEEVRRRGGKFEELVEMLLGRAEMAQSAEERARSMAEIGRIYFRDLNDHEQAVVAYSQAFCDHPIDEYALEIERACGTSEQLWAEALSSVGDASQNNALSPEQRTLLLSKAGVWYLHKLSRSDLALPCFQAVLAAEPSNEIALSAMTEIYRKAQQWQELGLLLTHRADAAATPAQARDLRAQSAELLEQRLGDVQGARAIYELILSEDPAHEKSGTALMRILEKSGDFDILVKMLEQRVEAQPSADAILSLCYIGEIYDVHLNNTAEAIKMFRKALERDAQSLDALRGLESVFTKLGKYQDLVENLEYQVSLAATPKQKISLLERIAAVQEEEFLNHEAAAHALSRALDADAGRISAMANLTRHFKVLGRWEECSRLYERQLELVEEPAERVSLAMAWGRILSEQVGSPERAVHAYELVLEAQNEHPGALEALAKLREATGDADQALIAILSLADQASSPEARAEQFMRAAQLQENSGNRDGAIEHYKNALDAQPENRVISAALRSAYVGRGDINAAVELISREIDVTEGDLAQAKLAGEMARLQRERLKDDKAAEASAEKALRLDPGNLDALFVLGDLCFEQRRYVESSSHYGRLADRVEALGAEHAVPILGRYVDSLSKSGSTEGALSAMDVLFRLAPDDPQAVGRVAYVTFEHGAPKRAAELLKDYLSRFSSVLSERERSEATYRLGESYRRIGETTLAIGFLSEAAELDPGASEPLIALGQVYLDAGNYEEAVKIKTEQLDVASGDTRVALLIEIGDISATHLGDRTQAAKSYVAALDERPDDRKLLTKLMQLYSEEKDWNKLIEVITKLAEFAEPQQKVKYLHTAALVSARQAGDPAQAAGFFNQVLELEPDNQKAMDELTGIHREAGNYNAVEDLIKRRIAAASEAQNIEGQIKAYDELAVLYQQHLVAPDRAAEAYEAASELDPDNRERLHHLAAIYAGDPERFKERGIQLQELLLSQDPFRPDAYKALRKIYTVSRDADASWALCQVLSVLKLAEPDETRFYERMRSETAAPAQDAFNASDWGERLMHPTLDPLLTGIFGLIQPAVVRSRAQPIQQFGVSPEMQIDPSQHDAPLAQTLYYAAGVLGQQLPAVFANPADPGGLSYMFTEFPSLSLGKMGMSHQVPPQVAAFVAAQQLTYLQPGLYLRQFIQTGTALKAWLFAAIKLSSPQFPVAPDLEGSVNEALGALKTHLAADAKDHLASVVSRLIQSGTSLDLKRWISAVDLTADRVAFVVAHDLQTAAEVIGAADESQTSVSREERYKQLILFASSSKYFALRERLGIRVDS